MKQRDAFARVLISTVALGTALLHIATPFKLDNVALTLLGIALIPWLASVLHGKERDVCSFFEITERGREYLQLRTHIGALGSNQSAH